MKDKKKLKLKKVHFHPVTTFIILIGIVIILSGLFSLLDVL